MRRRGQSAAYYPISLNISGKKCVVIGGGEVALRKITALLGHGAEITVISPQVCAGINELAASGQIRLLRRGYQPGDLTGALLAIAATDDGNINQEVVKEARGQAVLVNVVDDAALSDFIVPSCLHRGDVTVAVSTSGKSPALARKLRLKLEKEMGDEYAALVNLVGEVRAEVQRQGIKVNGDDWEAALDLDLLTGLLRRGNSDQARAHLLNNLGARQG